MTTFNSDGNNAQRIVFEKKIYFFWIFTLLTLVLLSFGFFRYIRKGNYYLKKQTIFLKEQAEFAKAKPSNYFVKNYLPSPIKNIVFADKYGLVLDTKIIKIRYVPNPYNSSIIKTEDGNYKLFFRYDIPKEYPLENLNLPLHTNIGVVELDSKFNQIKPFKKIDTGSMHSEDPRVICSGDRLFLSYNDIQPIRTYSRSIRLAELDPTTLDIKYVTNLDQHLQPVEKNWVPFVTEEEKGCGIHFIYQMNPHKILKVNETTKNDITHLTFENSPTIIAKLWPKKWGEPRGGTPPLLIDGEYLTFFHSCFTDKKTNTNWYVMGAYTFEAEAPFRITSISKEPILFSDIYSAKHGIGTNESLYCLFPSGAVAETKKNKNLLHVTCGENDSETRVVTMDRDILLQSMLPITYDNCVQDELVAIDMVQ